MTFEAFSWNFSSSTNSEIGRSVLLDKLAHWNVQMHKQPYKHPLDMIQNNIQETQDKLLVVFFQGDEKLKKKYR